MALGQAKLRLGDLRAAMGHHKATLELARAANEDGEAVEPWMGAAYHLVGVVRDAVQDLGGAVRACHQALDLYGSVGDEAGAARVHNSLGIIYSRSGDQERALERFQWSLEHERRNGRHERQAAILSNLCICLRLLGRPGDAIVAADEALAIVAEHGSKGDAAGVLTKATRLGS